jgi:hypothetical protein
MNKFLYPVLISLFALPQVAYGQWTWNPAPFQANLIDVVGQAGRSASVLTNETPAPNRVKKVTPVMVTFPPSLTVRKRNFEQFVAKTRTQSPETADKMAQLLASTDVIGAIGTAIAPYGLRTNNVADAYVLYWIAAWEASRGIVGSSESRERVQAVKAQAERALLATPEFVNATAAQKQELAEALLIQSALIQDTVNTFASDPVMLRKASASVTQGAKAFGIDLDAMTLTEEGFKPAKRRKSGAVDDEGKAINPTAEPTATAQNDAPPQSGGSTTQYALIAAAGGAGLAGVFLAGKAMGKKW